MSLIRAIIDLSASVSEFTCTSTFHMVGHIDCKQTFSILHPHHIHTHTQKRAFQRMWTSLYHIFFSIFNLPIIYLYFHKFTQSELCDSSPDMTQLVEFSPTDPLVVVSSPVNANLYHETRHLACTALDRRVPPIYHL